MKAADLDLRELLAFDPQGGIISFMGERALIFDAVALGLLRKELIETLGLVAARAILTRFGYAHGWRTAKTLQQEWPDLWEEGKAGPKIHTLHGLVNVTQNIRTDGLGHLPLVDATWQDSYEAEQHLLHVGLSDEPVCWTLVGFASGYVSFKENQDVYFIEDRCRGKGDSCCHISGRFRHKWGKEIEPHLQFYRRETIDATLNDLTAKLRSTENKLHARKKELSIVLGEDLHVYGMIVASDQMQKVLNLAERVALTDSSVVVTGESGVGKERIARLIHDKSARANKAFVSINCGAIPETLLERELFGHVRGAFTGAEKDALGLFEAATGGTLFLDEIGEIPLSMQVKLLRVLQEREIRRIGENRPRRIDVRIIAATNRTLQEEVTAGRFRKDLYYRLRVIEITVPPLRERREDILPLARFFLNKMNGKMKCKAVGFSPKAVRQLLQHDWPGNVRELQNTIEYALALSSGCQIDVDDLPQELHATSVPLPSSASLIRPLAEIEREYILAALRATNGNKVRAAAELNIGLRTLYRKLQEYDSSQPNQQRQ
ncbi:MAG: sigma-54-dependent Fis family transcriptional regulator [Nitrospiraceae bacterium]|jgi:DNA-binding NtrC family response regulator/predicted hydrocarbon binding protein|nr:sigma-54-dependent Fis family transcriptional regulator [Nitrospiraceae bacterium]